MASKDLYHDIEVREAKTDTAIDTAGYESLTFAVTAAGAAKATILAGDDAETLTEINADDYLDGPLDVAEAGTYKMGYRGTKKYAAVKLTGTGTTAVAILGHARIAPTI